LGLNDTLKLYPEIFGGHSPYAVTYSQGNLSELNIQEGMNDTILISSDEAGKFRLTAHVTDSVGCTSTGETRIYFSENIPIVNTYTVNTTNDVNDGVCDGMHCSFREAVNQSNYDGTKSLIEFNIPGSGLHAIKVSGIGPFLFNSTDGDIIDGLSQPGNNPMNGRIVIDLRMSIRGANWTLRGISFAEPDYENTRPYILNIGGVSHIIEDNWFKGWGIEGPMANSIIRRNVFRNTPSYAISSERARPYQDSPNFSQNLFHHNIRAQNNLGARIAPPLIHFADHNTVEGISQPFSLVEVYTSNNDEYKDQTCQGTNYLGTTVADQNGNWTLSGLSLSRLTSVTAFATSNTDQSSSAFCACYLLLPTSCDLAERVEVNTQPCATAGVVMDLTQLRPSIPDIEASCVSATHSDQDAWYYLVVPATGNVMVRTNINHTLPVMGYEVFTGDCGALVPADTSCGVLDSLPYAITFENYPPGQTIYLRVWDNDTTTSAPGNLIHITAHELPLNKDDWEICDQENNLINGNPTILSEKDADAFILEYDSDATIADIAQREADFIAEGLTKQDECLCNSNPLQLWRAANATDVEIKRRSAVRKAKVDTTNNNYLFEALEFQVNVFSAGNQIESDVAMDADGDFLITWVDEQRDHNYARLFNSSGNPVSQEFLIGSPNASQTQSKVAKSDNGSFVITWQDQSNSSNNSYIYHRRYNSSGVPVSAAIQSDTQEGLFPDISINATGDYITVWQGLTNDGSKIYVKKYSASGSVLLDKKEISVGGYISTFSEPSISLNASGQFALAWNGSDGDQSGVHVELYDTDGTCIQSEFVVHTTTSGIQKNADIILHNDGSYIVVWQSFGQEGAGLDYGVYARMFDATGSPLGNEFLVNTYTEDAQENPSISAFDDKSFFIAWDSYGQDGFAEGIFGQLFNPSGNKLGKEFQINALDDPQQEKPSTATNGNSIFMATWEDGANDGSLKGIFGQRYEKAGTNRYAIGTATPSTLLGDELIYPDITYQPINGGLANVRLAIIDTGVDPNNPWIQNALWTNEQANDGENCYIDDVNGYDFTNDSATPNDVDGHGTKVNGIITRDFAPGVDLDLMNLKFYENGKGTVFDAICGIYYAVDNGADIINLSWGFEASEFPAILNKALKYASDNDVLIVTSAGNTSKNNDRINKYPANLDIDNMIVVTSYEYKGSTNEKKLANYASYGKSNVDIAARGFVQTPSKGDTLTISAGTSLAAPLVSRTAAIIRGLYPMLTATDVKDCILSTAEQVNHLSNKVASGGILDHAAAVACALEKAGDCHVVDLYINKDQSIDASYKTDLWIQSDAQVRDTADVSFYAADHINLNKKFEVVKGSTFSAIIDSCGTSIVGCEIPDLIAPIIACPPNISVNTEDGLCSASGIELEIPSASDNCSTKINIYNNSSASFNVGTNYVQWTAIDEAGNADTCVQIVTVVDNENPVLNCLSNLIINTDINLFPITTAELIIPSASDNCSANIHIQSNTNGPLMLGDNEILWTATDESGNMDTCLQIITIVDTANNIQDIDGNIYKTIKIGSQWWMAENLKTTRYSNGEVLIDGTGLETNGDASKYFYNYSDSSNTATYGRFYNWHGAMNGAASSNNNPSDVQGVCPTGWHLPSFTEWYELFDFLGGDDIAGGKMKEIGLDHWQSPNEGATNESGFSGLPGGYFNGANDVRNIGIVGNWWSSTEVLDGGDSYASELSYRSIRTFANDYWDHSIGFSIRCVKD